MNNTDKATLDAAKRMLQGKIDINEVSMMLGVPVEKLQPLKDEVDEQVRKVYGNIDSYDFSEPVLFDNYDDLGNDDDIKPEEDEQ
ncbi:MAG: hypothetical protein E7271_02435 [Lachnospiraceae bacterium]|jgi:hypothetical protein|nr:hypothetical protein [Lachnospiraceae bacterium]